MDPWEADFSQQQCQDQNCHASMDQWMGGGRWGEDTFSTTIPPPSRLPRLYVLRYQILDLDDIVTQHLLSSSSLVSSRHVHNADENKSTASSYNQYCPDVLVKHFCTFNSSEKLAHALWLCLLSKADRKISSKNKKRDEMIPVGPMERALGCWSLQVSMTDLNNSQAFFQHLATKVLPQLCPVVATIDCTQAEDLICFGIGPSKDNHGRLRPCPLQLPTGSVLMIHYHPIIPTHQDSAIKAVINELVQHHRLSYRFEGGVILPFEADYQIIVVSTQTQQFPCTVSIDSKGCPRGPDIPSAADMVRLRTNLGRARSHLKWDGSKCHVTLSSSLIDRAQHYFLSQRRSIYKAKRQQESSHEVSLVSWLPGEDDLHRWLNTTKLLAKSRICSSQDEESKNWEATERDWEVALEFDDILH
jgi:hypothetical protein